MLGLVLLAIAAPCLAQCPHVNLSSDCAVLITINRNGALSVQIKCPPAGPTAGQHVGTTGGGLTEDDLTVPVALAAQTLLKAAHYAVVMTKTDANSCPTLRDRARTANHNRSNLFVSVHFNRPIAAAPFYARPFLSYGAQGLYSSTKAPPPLFTTSSSQQLATFLSVNVGSQLGNGSQGIKVDESNVLTAQYTVMAASIIEVGRLEGSDLTAIKAPGSAAKAAAGIKAAIDAFINQ